MTRSLLFACILIAVAMTLGGQQQQQQMMVNDETAIIAPLVTFSGAYSAIDQPRIVRIADKQSWDALWKEHRGKSLEHNARNWPVIPEINFEQCMVIAIFDGEVWNTDGVTMHELSINTGKATLRYDHLTFQTAGPDGGGVRTRPYGLFVLPRFGEPIELLENVQGLKDQPAKWKRQAELPGLAWRK